MTFIVPMIILHMIIHHTHVAREITEIYMSLLIAKCFSSQKGLEPEKMLLCHKIAMEYWFWAPTPPHHRKQNRYFSSFIFFFHIGNVFAPIKKRTRDMKKKKIAQTTNEKCIYFNNATKRRHWNSLFQSHRRS